MDPLTGQRLRTLVSTFYDVQKVRISLNNRLFQLDQKADFLDSVFKRSILIEDDIEDEIGREVQQFEFYDEYLSRIKGIGPMMGAVMLSELGLPRRFERIPDRDGEPRDHETVLEQTEDGVLVESPPSFEVSKKVSQIWSYCGYGSPEEKRSKGEKFNHNPFIKKKLHTIAKSFLQSSSHYRSFYDDAKEYYLENRDWTDGHCHNAAYRIVKKLFLSHAWEVWRTRRNLPTPEPYVFDKKGHDGYIAPFVEEGDEIIEVL